MAQGSTAAAATCARCKGSRYVLERVGEFSVAKPCGCTEQCSVCSGTGRIHLEENGYTFVKACSCRAVQRRVTLFNQVRLPARCGLSFDDYLPENEEEHKAREAARMTALRYRPDAPSKGFLIAGPVGTGKTHLLGATLRHVTLELGIPARYVELSFLYSEIRKGFAEHRSGLDAIQPLVETDVLAIDELGKGRGTPFELDTLDELIARRYNAGRTTLIATNYQIEAPRAQGFREFNDRTVRKVQEEELHLRERVGERIWSRLHEMCYLVQLPLNSRDRRTGQPNR